MPRFSLRTLIVVMLAGGPVLALLWWVGNQIPSLQGLVILLISLVGCCVFIAAFILAAAAVAWVVGILAAAIQSAVDRGPKTRE